MADRLDIMISIARALVLFLAAAVCAGFAVPATTATPERAHSAFDAEIAAMPEDALEELFVFVAGNALFTLYHEGGHMLVSELGLPVLAQEEDAVDNLATVTMLAADDDDMDLLLTQAMIGWFLIADDSADDLVFHDEHDLDLRRGYTMLCLMVGADADAFLGLARDLGLPDERTERCAADYEQASRSWDAVTAPFLRDSDTPAGRIRVIHEEAAPDDASLALFLKESALMEEVAAEFDTLYDLPGIVTFRAAACGEENAFWDPERREVVLCHELLGGFAQIYLGLLGQDSAAE